LSANHGLEASSYTTIKPLPEGDGRENRPETSENPLKTGLNGYFTFLTRRPTWTISFFLPLVVPIILQQKMFCQQNLHPVLLCYIP
jgi:hypothetical protein